MSIITLTTDFGTADYFVGAMKGAVLSIDPAATVVDITHDVPAHDVRAGAFALFAAYKTFPSGTIHVAVVDPGVGSERRPILAIAENHIFVAPDNGILSFVYEHEPNTRVYHITNDRFFRHPVSTTFHGRDIFAPAAGAISRGVTPDELGDESNNFARFEIPKAQRSENGHISANILHIDRFGNCLVNLMSEDLPPDYPDNSLKVEINGHEIAKIQNYYAQASRQGELFLIFGSAGLLEIVAFQDSAAKILQAEINQPLSCTFTHGDC